MLGVMIITKRGQDKLEAFHQHQDFVVTTTAVNVVYLQFRQDLVLQYLKCGAAVLQELEDVAVCRVIQEMVALTQLNQQQ
tara:strand:+ start:182 stop:421 length:240 start_codon:yes stop_codon:yes gene_type:complete